MRDQDDLPYIVIERQSVGFAPFFWGLVIGTAVGILIAPRAGRETKDEIRQRVDRARARAESARDSVHRTRERVEDRITAVREQIGSVRERMESRIDPARRGSDGDRGPAGNRAPGSAGRYSASAPDRSRRDFDVYVTDTTDESLEDRPDLG